MKPPVFTRSKRPAAFAGIVIFFLVFAFHLIRPLLLLASSGTEGASFLELPVGARPAAMGSAYTTLANDAYAPTWNPAGLGFLQSTQAAGMHQIYAEDTAFEYASIVHPIKAGHALGAAIQYFQPGTLTGRDINGNSIGNISGSYAAYSLAYGQEIIENLSLGATGKWIHATIDGVSASAYGGDVGALYRINPQWRLAGTLDNLGSKLTFLQSGDSLPLAGRLGAAYNPLRELTLAAEVAAQKSGPFSGHFGGEWMNAQGFSFRVGYDTQRVQQLTPVAGISVGVGLSLWGQEFSYAFLPLGDFGFSHYFSLVLRFGRHAALADESLMDATDMDDNHSLMNEMIKPEDEKNLSTTLDMQ